METFNSGPTSRCFPWTISRTADNVPPHAICATLRLAATDSPTGMANWPDREDSTVTRLSDEPKKELSSFTDVEGLEVLVGEASTAPLTERAGTPMNVTLAMAGGTLLLNAVLSERNWTRIVSD